MRVFNKNDFVGEWSNESWKFRAFENGDLKINWKNGQYEARGTFRVFENFLIFHYNAKGQQIQWTARIDNIENNVTLLTDITNKIGQVEKLKKTFGERSLIKQFEFDKLSNLTIDELKKEFNLLQLRLNKLSTINGEITDYYRHWDYRDRYAIILKAPLMEEIKKDRNLPLEVKKTLEKGKLGYYSKFVIRKYEKPSVDPIKHISEDFEQQDYSEDPFTFGDPSNDNNENPWIEVFGEGEEAETAYWNTD